MRNSQQDNPYGKTTAVSGDGRAEVGARPECCSPTGAERSSSKGMQAPQKIACDIDEIPLMTLVGRTKVYEAINSRELRAKKFGRRTCESE